MNLSLNKKKKTSFSSIYTRMKSTLKNNFNKIMH